LQGEVACMKNTGKNTVFLTPTNFYQSNLLAASLEKNTLKAGEEMLFYKVVAHD
jgi:hypothetical protein